MLNYEPMSPQHPRCFNISVLFMPCPTVMRALDAQVGHTPPLLVFVDRQYHGCLGLL